MRLNASQKPLATPRQPSYCDGMKTFTTKSNLVTAIKRGGLQNVPHEIQNRNGQWSATFTVETPEDAKELRARGWDATLLQSPKE